MTLYSDLVGKLEELHDPDEDISAHREAMRVLNHLWPTIAQVQNENDAWRRTLRLLVDDTDQGDA